MEKFMNATAKTVLNVLDKALAPAPTPENKKRVEYSPDLIRESCKAIKFTIHDADIADLEKLDKPRRKGAEYVSLYSQSLVKPEWLRRSAEAAKKVRAGESVTPPTRSHVAEEFDAGRRLGREAAMPAASGQVEICRRILLDLAIEIEKNVNSLSDHATSQLARMLVDDIETIAKVHKAQAAHLRMFAKKLNPSPWFNWRNALSDFGIPIPK